MMIRHLIGVASLCFAAPFLSARIAAQTGSLATETFQESMRTNAPTAGEVFRGLHKSTLDGRPRFDQLSVALPAGNHGRLCVTVETQDARYFAQASYLIGRRASAGTRTLQLPTAHRSFLESLPIRDVSIIAFVADSCQSGERLFLPLFLGVPRLTGGSLVLLINSRTPGVTVRIFHVEGKRYLPSCATDSLTERQVAFNVECHIELPVGTHHATLTVVRNRGEKVLEPETIAAYIP